MTFWAFLLALLVALLLLIPSPSIGSAGSVSDAEKEGVKATVTDPVQASEHTLLSTAIISRTLSRPKTPSSLAQLPVSRPPSTPTAPLLCTRLTPSDDAVAYSPGVFLPQRRPSVTARGAEAVGALWRLELCLGSAGHEVAFEYGLPGILALLNPPTGDLALARAPAATAPPCPLGSCEGVIRISRLRDCPVSNGTLGTPPLTEMSADTLSDAARLGPDELDVTLEGPEFFSAVKGVHIGNCVYEFPFAVSIPGEYRVLVIAVRSDWRSIDESLPGFPPVTLDRVSGRRLLISLGGTGTSDAAASASGATVALQAAVLDSTARAAALPQCPVSLTYFGRWVRTADAAIMFAKSDPPIPPFERRAFPDGPGEGFYTDRVKEISWLPMVCRSPGITEGAALLEDARVCLRRLRVLLFIGDSQTRAIFNAFVKIFTVPNAKKVEAKGSTNVVCANQGGKGMRRASLSGLLDSVPPGDFLVCFFWDPFASMSTAALVELGGVGAAVVNFGQHFAASSRRTVQVYALKVRERFGATDSLAAISSRASASPHFRVAWLETMPFPIRNDKYVHQLGDWRTTHRLALYNAAAKRELTPLAALRTGILSPFRYVPTMDVLAPLADNYDDNAHPDVHREALRIIAARILGALCGSE